VGADHALWPAVVSRKVCGGSPTDRGAHTEEMLTSVLRTLQQRQLTASSVFSDLRRAPTPITALASGASGPVGSLARMNCAGEKE
jgi:hypothetical protein